MTPADKTQESKSQSAANPISQNQSIGEQTFQLADNRPEAVMQRKLHEMANNSWQQNEAAQLHAIANSQTSQLDAPLQKKATSESAPKANNTGLPDALKSGIENLSGYSMDDVKVHRNSDQPAQLQAHAYAQGTNIHLGPGQEKHLPHEAWHVVQQKQGRVKPTMQMKGKVNVNDDVGLEKEADVMGVRALNTSIQMKSVAEANTTSNSLPVVQRVVGTETLRLALDKILKLNLEKKKKLADNEVKNPFFADIRNMREHEPEVQDAAPSIAKFKGKNVHGSTKDLVKKRIKARGGAPIESQKITDENFTKKTDYAIIGKNVASMANDPAFEAAAMRFEEQIGVLAHNHPKSIAVCKLATSKILIYIINKHIQAKESEAAINEDLKRLGMSSSAWSGAIGRNVEGIRDILEEGGSVGEMIAHIEAFSTNILMKDIMEDNVPWRIIANKLKLNSEKLESAYGRSAFTGDKYLGYELPENGAGANQWHTRVKMINEGGQAFKSKHHPSNVKSTDTESDSQTVRKKEQITAESPVGIGLKLGKHEENFQRDKTKGDDRVAWEEGARIWALNEIDSWVFIQRQLSLPLAGGASSTTARIMQAFQFLGIEANDDVRLAAIGALLPPRHHSLVEVMFGAAPFGATIYRQGPKMYYDIHPLAEKEIREKTDFFPDELVDPNGIRSGRSRENVPLPVLASNRDEVEVEGPGMPGRMHRLNEGQQDIEEELGPKVGFGISRRSIRTDYNVSKKTRIVDATLLMLKAIDDYHASTGDIPKQMKLLVVITKQANLWLSKYENSKIRLTKTKNAYRAARDEAKAAIEDYEASYVRDLIRDDMLADSSHATSPNFMKNATPDSLSKKHGLTQAEVIAINVYCGPAYKFINPALEGDDLHTKERLGGFVRETKDSKADSDNIEVTKKAAKKAREKLLGSEDPVARAIAESIRHAAVIMMGLEKLPIFTNEVFAGGCITKKEALARFSANKVITRASFASTSSNKTTAIGFATDKYAAMSAKYDPELDPPEDVPFMFLLNYISKSGRRIDEFSSISEYEILFASGTKLLIKKGANSPDHEQKDYSEMDPEMGVLHIITAEEV